MMIKKSNKIKIYISDTFDPWFNLATEDWIFRDMDTEYSILFLWRNDQTVVIGRFQNPWTECHTEKMELDQIKLARRQSGGGAVFQDLGNTNFTFLNSKNDYDKLRNNQIIIDAIARFGITATASGRNDIVVNTSDGTKKVSGSAFKETKDRSFHHGTLLINTDLSKLANYLSPNEKKLSSKGIQSVRARVTNLSDLNSEICHENMQSSIIEEFCKAYDSEAEIILLRFDDLQKIEKLAEHYLRIKDWKWRFGEAPSFTHTMSEYFAWGMIEVYFEVEKAVILSAKVYSDSLHPEMIEQVMASLNNIPYNKESIFHAVSKLKIDLPMYAEYLDEFCAWLIKEIN